jgi:hypothetical protein
MPRPRSALLVFAIACGLYLGMFATDHSESLAGSPLTYFVIYAPFVMVLAAAVLWRRYWLVPATFVFFFAIPIAIDEFERRTGLYPVGTTAATYEQSGMDNLTTSFLSIFAYPATVLAVISVFIVRRVVR